jgi:pSer/pThr/pTyr-binding forkhead associated (FHA) protein
VIKVNWWMLHMPKLIIKNGGNDQGSSIALKPGINRFGRHPANDHQLADDAVSDAHCEILVDGDFIFVRDLGSTNGTYVNGERVMEAALYTGSCLKIGPVEFELDAPVVRLVLPELPKPETEEIPVAQPLADGYPNCPNHPVRHPHLLR